MTGLTLYFAFCCFLICWTIWAAVRSSTSAVDLLGLWYTDQITVFDFRSTRKIVPLPWPKVEICGAGLSFLSALPLSLSTGGGYSSTSFCRTRRPIGR